MAVVSDTHHVVGAGPVVLDIGDGIGAAIVTAPMSLVGREVEIRSADAAWDGRHVAFHVRQTIDRRLNAAVFPQLAEGEWQIRLCHDAASPVVPLRVLGGCVTTVPYPE
jgi:hypothetical protein